MTRRALILAAHGSSADASVNAGICRLAARLQREVAFETVVAAFHRGSPQLSEILETVEAKEWVVVPFMTSAGYFATTVLPEQLTRADRHDVAICVTSPVGIHSAVANMVADRVSELLRANQLAAAETAVLIAGHGTRRNAASREATVQLADTLLRRDLSVDVHVAFLDDQPELEVVMDGIDSQAVIVIPFMMAAGPHVYLDMPIALGLGPVRSDCLPTVQRIKGQTVIYDQPVGSYPRMADVVREIAESVGTRSKVRDARRRTFRIGTRSSRLAMWQAASVANLLRIDGVSVEVVPIATSGDRKLDCAIADLESPVPFCDDIERALQTGEIDLAVHSQKDLGLIESPHLSIAAVLARGDAREALVTRCGLKLRELPVDAVVGTSSPRRAAQILRLRPDLVTVPIRGAVDDRVAQIQRGAFDAAVLAVAGLERIGLTDAIAERFELDAFPPAPAQAAMAVQVRRDDRDAHNVVARLNHEPTRQATWVELELLKRVEEAGAGILSAIARVGDRVDVVARLIHASEDGVRDIRVSACDPESALAQATQKFGLDECPPPGVPVGPQASGEVLR